IDYLMKSLECLTESLITIQPIQDLQPATVNITYSRKTQKGIAVKYMIGASVRCEVPMNNKMAKLKVQNVQTLDRASDVKNVLTKSQLAFCKHNLENCSESVPWEAMRGQLIQLMETLQECVVLYTHTLSLPKDH